MELWIPRSLCSPLGDDEYYEADIVGCSVRSPAGEVGTVRSVIEGIQAPLMEVAGAAGDVQLVPFLGVFVAAVDIPQKLITLTEEWIPS
jgi:16S rRNA processing protein RimM